MFFVNLFLKSCSLTFFASQFRLLSILYLTLSFSLCLSLYTINKQTVSFSFLHFLFSCLSPFFHFQCIPSPPSQSVSLPPPAFDSRDCIHSVRTEILTAVVLFHTSLQPAIHKSPPLGPKRKKEMRKRVGFWTITLQLE